MASSRRPSPSTMQRTLVCPAWLALPHVKQPSSEAAEWGKAGHAFVISLATAGAGTSTIVPAEYTDRLMAIDMATFGEWKQSRHAGKWRGEVAFRYYLIGDTAEELGCNLDRDYGETSTAQIAGAADLFAHYDGEGWICDLKTGKEVTSAAHNAQLATLALMAARAHNLDRVHVSIAYLGDNGRWTFDEATLDALDLDGWAAALREANSRVIEAQSLVASGRVPDVARGSYCSYCPALSSCPSTTALVPLFTGKACKELTKENAPEVWMLIEQAKVMVKMAEERMTAFARYNPFELPGGKVVMEVETSREYVNGAVAAKVLPPEVAKLAIEPSTSKTAIAKACKALGCKAEPLIDALRASGGLETKVTRSVKEVKK